MHSTVALPTLHANPSCRLLQDLCASQPSALLIKTRRGDSAGAPRAAKTDKSEFKMVEEELEVPD